MTFLLTVQTRIFFNQPGGYGIRLLPRWTQRHEPSETGSFNVLPADVRSLTHGLGGMCQWRAAGVCFDFWFRTKWGSTWGYIANLRYSHNLQIFVGMDVSTQLVPSTQLLPMTRAQQIRAARYLVSSSILPDIASQLPRLCFPDHAIVVQNILREIRSDCRPESQPGAELQPRHPGFGNKRRPLVTHFVSCSYTPGRCIGGMQMLPQLCP
jgi:hypothetical protein